MMVKATRSIPFLELPIVQAPLSGATTPALVAAVSNAGGLGSLPVGYESPAAIGTAIAQVRALTARSFAVNLFVDTSAPSPPASWRAPTNGCAAIVTSWGSRTPRSRPRTT